MVLNVFQSSKWKCQVGSWVYYLRVIGKIRLRNKRVKGLHGDPQRVEKISQTREGV